MKQEINVISKAFFEFMKILDIDRVLADETSKVKKNNNNVFRNTDHVCKRN